MTRYWKVLGGEKGANSIHAGYHQWSLPRGRRPGAWTPSTAVVMCQSGYHLASDIGLPRWGTSPHIYLAEGRGYHEAHYDGDKVAFASARLLAKVQWSSRTLPMFVLTALTTIPHRSSAEERAFLDLILEYITNPHMTVPSYARDWNDVGNSLFRLRAATFLQTTLTASTVLDWLSCYLGDRDAALYRRRKDSLCTLLGDVLVQELR